MTRPPAGADGATAYTAAAGRLRFDRLEEFHVLLVEDEKDYEESIIAALKDLIEWILSRHRVAGSRIIWTRARSLRAASEILAAANAAGPGHRGWGFDLVLLDIKIVKQDGDPRDSARYEYGLEFARQVRQTPRASSPWPCALIGLSQWADRLDLLEQKMRLLDAPDGAPLPRMGFDDFLFKQDILGDAELARAKLQRCIVPLGRYIALARKWTPPAIFENNEMRRILRDLVLVSRADIAGDDLTRNLPRILLLGDPGSGKTMLASVYDSLLRQRDVDLMGSLDRAEHYGNLGLSRRQPPQQVNCAGLVPEGEGGRLVLFGHGPAEGFDARPRAGAFEKATSYRDGFDRRTGLAKAEEGKQPIPNAQEAGVVFLDEFAEMDPELQAATLKAVDEGVVIRQDGSTVPVACHVVFATNADIRRSVGSGDQVSAGTKRMREDLVDRIPYVIRVPPLSERRDEIPALIEGMVAGRLKQLGWTGDGGVQISTSAQRLIERAVALEVIKSIRQLQSIASVGWGEHVITDSNVAWVLEKARLLGINRRLLVADADHVTLAEKIDALGLPGELESESLPETTRRVIDLLFNRLRGDEPFRPPGEIFAKTSAGDDERSRYYLMTGLLSPQMIQRLYSDESEGKSLRKLLASLRQRRSQRARKHGLEIGNTDNASGAILRFLLTAPAIRVPGSPGGYPSIPPE